MHPGVHLSHLVSAIPTSSSASAATCTTLSKLVYTAARARPNLDAPVGARLRRFFGRSFEQQRRVQARFPSGKMPSSCFASADEEVVVALPALPETRGADATHPKSGGGRAAPRRDVRDQPRIKRVFFCATYPTRAARWTRAPSTHFAVSKVGSAPPVLTLLPYPDAITRAYP